MKIRLIALDLDGTLLTDQKELSERNRTALFEAAARGALIVPATGRFFSGMPTVIRALPFLRYGININGGKVWDETLQQTLYSAYIPYETCEEIYDYLETLPVLFDCYQYDCGWIDRRFYDLLWEYVRQDPVCGVITSTRKITEDFRALMHERHDSAQKIQILCREGDEPLRQELLRTLPVRFAPLNVSTSLYCNIEINAPLATKGQGLQALCRALSIPIGETAAFGDGLNDLDLLKAAGIGVAMENAHPSVKAAADQIAGSNNENGVAQVIDDWIRRGLL